MASENPSATSGALLTEAVAVFKRNWPLLLVASAVVTLVQVGRDFADREKLAGAAGIILFTLVTMLVTMGIQAS